VQDQWGPSYFGYDEASRVAQRSTPRGDAVYYQYDGYANLSALAYPGESVAAYYTYDVLGRMTGVRSPAERRASFAYDASRNLIRKELGNGIVAWAGCHQAERITSLRYAKAEGTAVAYFDYGREVGGRFLRIARQDDLVVYYGYDDVDRLTAKVAEPQMNPDGHR